MNPAYLAPLANHLWQSTAFAAAAGLLTLALRNNPARVRHWVWIAASYKFLIPLAVLIALGGQVRWRKQPEISVSNLAVVMDAVSQPFAARSLPVALPVAQPASTPWPAILLGIWACGFLGIALAWWVRWRRIRAAVCAGSPLPLAVPIRVVSSPTLLEPGIFGVCRPVLVLPEGILEKLTPAQLEAVIEHEFCHVRHRDNLTAAIQMLVETIFWFHPLVWWMGTRMVEERERACDEEVLQRGSQPRDYAEGILRISEHYVESQLVCVAGVTGADLKKRIQAILDGRVVVRLNRAKKAMLVVAAAVAISAPIVVGVLGTSGVRAQTQSPTRSATARPSFDVASVKRQPWDGHGSVGVFVRGNTLDAEHCTLYSLVEFAWDLRDIQLAGGPSWAAMHGVLDSSDLFQVIAKAEDGSQPSKEQVRIMLQALLADRFQLRISHGSKDLAIYNLVPAKGGPKLKTSSESSKFSLNVNGRIDGGKKTRVTATHVTIANLVEHIAHAAGRPVFDQTGLAGFYDFEVEWARNILAAAAPDGSVSDPTGSVYLHSSAAATWAKAGFQYGSVRHRGH